MSFALKRWVWSLLLATGLAGQVNAQGLGSPSSVQGELKPGDGWTDPQFRSGFPRNVAPGWFGWQDRLAKKGHRFNLDYLALGQPNAAPPSESPLQGRDFATISV